MIVVDASVAVKWMLPEPGAEVAQGLLTDAQPLVAPTLIRIEVTGAILRCHRTGRISEPGTRIALAAWQDILNVGRLQLVPDEELMPVAIDYAIAAMHALPDCLYVAAAKRVGVELLTADATLQKRLKPLHPDIVMLGSLHARRANSDD